MSRKINPVIKQKIKESLRKGIDAKNACLKAGLAPSTANNATQLTSVKQCQRELIAEFKASGVTAEKVLADLEHTRLLALTKEDYATATRCAELQGKYIAMFTDKQQSNVTVSEERKREIEKLFSCSIAGE